MSRNITERGSHSQQHLLINIHSTVPRLPCCSTGIHAQDDLPFSMSKFQAVKFSNSNRNSHTTVVKIVGKVQGQSNVIPLNRPGSDWPLTGQVKNNSRSDWPIACQSPYSRETLLTYSYHKKMRDRRISAIAHWKPHQYLIVHYHIKAYTTKNHTKGINVCNFDFTWNSTWFCG